MHQRTQNRPPAASSASEVGLGLPTSAAHRLDPDLNSTSIEGELLRLQDEINHLRRALDHQERLATLGTIAGLIAHEFNNILTPVHSYAQMALDAPNDHQLAHKALERSLSGAERASQIAGAILGFVRDESGCPRADGLSQVGPHRHHRRAESAGETAIFGDSCRVAAAVDEALTCIGRDLARDGITLSLSVPNDLSAAFRPIALQHVVMNLVLNARQAMLSGGGTLRIAAELQFEAPPPSREETCSLACSTWNGRGSNQAPSRSSTPSDLNDLITNRIGWFKQQGGCVVIEVADSGRGMNSENVAAMFAPFFTHTDSQAQSGERRRGTGLGTTVCKRLVEDAGGYLLVRSEPGRGTRVRVVLPISIIGDSDRK